MDYGVKDSILKSLVAALKPTIKIERSAERKYPVIYSLDPSF